MLTLPQTVASGYLACKRMGLQLLVRFRWLSGQRIRPPVQETQVQSLGREDPPEEEMAHSSILAWKSPMERGV